MVTINARDFIRLLDVEIHPGLIVLREAGLTRGEQWARILPLIEHIRKSGDADLLVNKLVEVLAPGPWEVREIPGRCNENKGHRDSGFASFLEL